MSDIFGRSVNYGGGFKGDDAVISISGVSAGALVQSLSFEYGQAMTRIWDLTSSSVFIVAGRAEGNWSIARIVGPGGFMRALVAMDVCDPGTVSFSAGKGFCDASDNTTYNLNHVVTTGVRSEVTTETMMMQEAVGGIFLSLSID